MKQNEELKDAYTKIKRARKKMFSAGTPQLTVQSPNEEGRRYLNDKDEIESILMEFNKDNYQGANDTPFM